MLTPAEVDPASGYRRYATAQVPIAQVIRRFRAPDVAARDAVVVRHLTRMQAQLDDARREASRPAMSSTGTTRRRGSTARSPSSPPRSPAQRRSRGGPDSALYSAEFFERHRGEVVAIPAARLAVTVHRGPFSDLDRTYGAPGTFVAERALGAEGPVRERYLDAGTTDVCWPINQGGAR